MPFFIFVFFTERRPNQALLCLIGVDSGRHRPARESKTRKQPIGPVLRTRATTPLPFWEEGLLALDSFMITTKIKNLRAFLLRGAPKIERNQSPLEDLVFQSENENPR